MFFSRLSSLTPIFKRASSSTSTNKLDLINEQLTKLKEQIMKGKLKRKDSTSLTTSSQATRARIQPFSLRVLSTGYLNDTKSCLLISDDRAYLINCGESISRFLNSEKIGLKRIEHLFLTRVNWNCIGGLNSLTIELGQDNKPLKMHSAFNFLNEPRLNRCVFEKNCQISQHGYKTDFEDENIRVKAIHQTINESSYLFTLKKTAPKILKEKLDELKLEQGAWIKDILNDIAYTAPDGRIIQPNDLLDYSSAEEKHILFIDCISESSLKQVIEQTDQLTNDTKVLLVHLSNKTLIETELYSTWMQRLNGCNHLVLDETKPTIEFERIYELQAQLNLVNKSIFPLLPAQMAELLADDLNPNYITAKTNQIFHIRPDFKIDSEKIIKINNQRYLNNLFTYYESDIKLAIEGIEPKVQEILNQLKLKVNNNETDQLASNESNSYPKVLLLGSSSAQASAYRNVSAILVKLNESTSLLLDCGEGTKNQLARFFPTETLSLELSKIKCVFITHNHTDHHNGLYGLVCKRAKAFKALNLDYEPLILMFPRNLINHLNAIDRICNEDFFNLVKLVPNELFLIDYLTKVNAKEKRIQINQLYLAEDFKSNERIEIINRVKTVLHLADITTIRVIHIPYSYALCLLTNNQFKLAYSGDCRPSNYLTEVAKDCDLLIHECTFDDTRMDRALSEQHSTLSEVIDVLIKMKAKNTILTHFSPRYGVYPCTNQPFRAGVIFGFDFMMIDTHNVKYLSDEATTDVLRVLFKEQIEINLIRSDKKISKRKLDDQEAQLN